MISSQKQTDMSLGFDWMEQEYVLIKFERKACTEYRLICACLYAFCRNRLGPGADRNCAAYKIWEDLGFRD